MSSSNWQQMPYSKSQTDEHTIFVGTLYVWGPNIALVCNIIECNLLLTYRSRPCQLTEQWHKTQDGDDTQIYTRHTEERKKYRSRSRNKMNAVAYHYRN